MSRRAPPNPAAERAAQNQQTIKTLLKLEGNKSCADCKRNKHPRWASWNLGVFVCIRCSGIHRGMGTHISRVKSVDLDAWTDEQLQSVLKWGNSRANKYWEAKLASGHVPSDGKMENFIRTKYESKRWVMDGQMPDPSTLDAEGDDDVPLNIVQEKAKLERGSSQRISSSSSQPVHPPPKTAPPVDLFSDVPEPPARPNTTDTLGARPPPAKTSGPPKSTKASDSLLGLDFFGGPASGSAARSSSTSSTPANSAVPSRPDLKQSILSLYASAPKPQPPAQHDRQSSFGGIQSPPAQQQSSLGGLDDAFGGFNFNTTSPPAPKPQQQSNTELFSSFSSPATQRSAAPQVTSQPLSGGGFFDAGLKLTAKPPIASKPPQPPQANLSPAASNDFGDFSIASNTPAPPKPATTSTSSDLFDFSDPSPPAAPAQKPTATSPPPRPSSNINSAFNLSAPATKSRPTTQSTGPSAFANLANTASWGSNDVWADPEPTTAAAPKPKPAAPIKAPSIPMSSDFSAWGGAPPINDSSSFGNGFGASSSHAAPKVAQDEDFGGWSSAAPVTPAASNPPPAQSKPAGGGFGGGSDDLFSNVWE